MRRIITSCTLYFIALTASTAQPLQNPSFEQWSVMNTHEPYGWVTNNVYIPPPFVPVTSVNTSFGTGVRMESIGGYAPGYILNTTGNLFNGDGGVSYTGNGIPTELNGIYRCNIKAGKNAYIYLYLKRNGAIISRDTFKISGAQGNFTAFSLPIKPLAVAPDTILLAAAAGLIAFKPGLQPVLNSWLELDELTLSNSSGIYPIPYGNFDIWPVGAIDIPDTWSFYGNVTKTTDKQNGMYAVKLMSQKETGGVGIAHISHEDFPVSPYTDTLIGYYKYMVQGAAADSAEIVTFITDVNHTNPINGYITLLPPAASYTQFKIPLPANGSISTVSFTIASSTANTATDSSSLYIDNLQLKSGFPVTVNNVTAQQEITLYPNPVQDVLYIRVNEVNEPVHIKITDVRGSIVSEKQSKGASTITLPLAQLAGGVYFCEIKQGETLMREKLIKQ